MSELIYQTINIIRLSTGRRLYALRRIKEIAAKWGLDALIAMIDTAIEHDTRVYEHELAWRRGKELPEARGNAAELDLAIDRVLGGICRQLEDITTAAPGTPVARPAEALRMRLFPSGLKPIVHQTFEEQLSNDQAILSALQADEEKVASLGLTLYLNRLADLTPRFSEELGAHPQPEVSWDQLCAMRDLGNVHLRRIVASILTVGALDDEGEAKRAQLMRPIHYQIARVVGSRKSSSGAFDIDPATGEEVRDPAPDSAVN
jgi:hypothetical protein